MSEKRIVSVFDTPYYIRCVPCGHVIKTEAEAEGLTCCPSCESTGVPLGPKYDVSIKINWQELRILCMWAEQWANVERTNPDPYMLKVVRGIAERIQEQHPDMTAPLTFAGETKQLRDKFGADKVQIVGKLPQDDELKPPDKPRFDGGRYG